MTDAPLRIPAEELLGTMYDRLLAAGLAPDMAEATANILLEADLLGHRTHGLAMLPVYLDCIAEGAMASSGAPEVLSERGASALWHGHQLSGAWLTLQAIRAAEDMARTHGTGTVVIRRSFHIGALAAYLEAVARRELVLILQCSAPHAATVAPHGGKTPVLSPSPLAIGYPAGDSVVMIDVSTSVTSNSMVRQVAREGGRLPHPWVIGDDGVPTDDPRKSEVILPLGGIEAGHKGFAMALMVEALTAGLAATGRDGHAPKMGGTVFVQVIDPQAFGGSGPLAEVMGDVSALCRSADPISPDEPVRLPGEAALRRKADQLKNGVIVSPDIWGRIMQGA